MGGGERERERGRRKKGNKIFRPRINKSKSIYLCLLENTLSFLSLKELLSFILGESGESFSSHFPSSSSPCQPFRLHLGEEEEASSSSRGESCATELEKSRRAKREDKSPSCVCVCAKSFFLSSFSNLRTCLSFLAFSRFLSSKMAVAAPTKG